MGPTINPFGMNVINPMETPDALAEVDDLMSTQKILSLEEIAASSDAIVADIKLLESKMMPLVIVGTIIGGLVLICALKKRGDDSYTEKSETLH